MVKKSYKYQYYAACTVNISTIIYGILNGWSSPTFPILKSDDTPIASGPMSSELLSWVASIMCLGGVIGTILYGYIVDIIGRRRSLWLLTIPHLVCYILILVAENPYYLLVGRFLGGIAGGATYVIVPLYVTEISEYEIRGSLGSILVLSSNIGVLIAFVIGGYCNYKTAALIYVCLPFIYFISIMYLPETPYHLVRQNKIEESEKSFAYYRNQQTDCEFECEKYKLELENLKAQTKKVTESDKVTYKDFGTRQALKAMGIGIGILCLNLGCGCFALLNYTSTIFIEGGSNMSPNMSAIIVAVIQVFGSYISTILVDKTGRKICLSLSSFCTCVGLVAMGTFQHLKILDYAVEQYAWISVASFASTLFCASCGIITLPFVVLSEIMPVNIRATALSISMVFSWTLAFIFLKYIYMLFEVFGLHGASYFFASICFLGTLFIMVCVPETKGKSLDEIQKLL